MAEAPVNQEQLDLDPVWRAWIAENLAVGVSRDDVVVVLQRRGVPVDRAHRYVNEEYELRPCRTGADARILRTLAAVYNEDCTPGVNSLDPETSDLAERFFGEFYRLNRPVVISGFARKSPVLRWTISALRTRFGQHSVLVQTNRGYNHLDAFLRGKQKRMLLGDYLDSIDRGHGNETYLTGNDQALSEPGLRPLADDLIFRPAILDETRTRSHANLWIGGRGATSPLHCDQLNVLNLQVTGRKRFLLAHPGSMPDVYSIRGKFSVVDALDADLGRFPDFARVRLFEAVLDPSDALFIPVGWWHHVTALEPSVNVSFTNFCAPNQYN